MTAWLSLMVDGIHGAAGRYRSLVRRVGILFALGLTSVIGLVHLRRWWYLLLAPFPSGPHGNAVFVGAEVLMSGGNPYGRDFDAPVGDCYGMYPMLVGALLKALHVPQALTSGVFGLSVGSLIGSAILVALSAAMLGCDPNVASNWRSRIQDAVLAGALFFLLIPKWTHYCVDSVAHLGSALVLLGLVVGGRARGSILPAMLVGLGCAWAFSCKSNYLFLLAGVNVAMLLDPPRALRNLLIINGTFAVFVLLPVLWCTDLSSWLFWTILLPMRHHRSWDAPVNFLYEPMTALPILCALAAVGFMSRIRKSTSLAQYGIVCVAFLPGAILGLMKAGGTPAGTAYNVDGVWLPLACLLVALYPMRKKWIVLAGACALALPSSTPASRDLREGLPSVREAPRHLWEAYPDAIYLTSVTWPTLWGVPPRAVLNSMFALQLGGYRTGAGVLREIEEGVRPVITDIDFEGGFHQDCWKDPSKPVFTVEAMKLLQTRYVKAASFWIGKEDLETSVRLGVWQSRQPKKEPRDAGSPSPTHLPQGSPK